MWFGYTSKCVYVKTTLRKLYVEFIQYEYVRIQSEVSNKHTLGRTN